MTDTKYDAHAQEGNHMYFPVIETHFIHSKHVAQTFNIHVMQPAQKKGETKKYPVVYTGDGNAIFDIFKGISYLIQGSGEAPPFILVGISYPSNSPVAGSLLRSRDFTFPTYPQPAVFPPPPMKEVLVAEEGTKTWFGAEDFQRFISDELAPFIDETYETISGDRTYFGHSAGGSFGLFTMFTKTDLFKNYIVSSPGLVYHGEFRGNHYNNYDFVFQMAREFIVSKKSLEGITLYMSAGTEEEFENELACWQITSSFYRMAGLLKEAAIPGLKLLTESLLGETHMTVWPVAFTHGIQAVFGTRRIRHAIC